MLTTYLITPVLAEFDTANDLLIDEVGSDSVRLRIMPRSKDLFTEEEPPGSIPFHCSLFLGILLTLRDCVHYMITTASQGRNLITRGKHLS